MAPAIRESISGAFGFEPICINSALVSAQNRQRLYWVGIRNEDGTYRKADIEQPEDRGILLKDILESGWDLTSNDKSFCLTARYQGAVPWNTIERGQRTMIAEPVPLNMTKDGKSQCIRATCYKDGIRNMVGNNVDKKTCVAEPICHIIPQEVSVRKYSCDLDELKKLLRNNKNKTNKEIAEALGKPITMVEHWFRSDKSFSVPDADIWFDLKALLGITTTEFDDYVTVFETKEGTFDKKNVDTVKSKTKTPIYEVKDGKITIKGRQYPIKLADGYYIIRKLTVTECKRLQTVPDDYDMSVISNTQAYRCLGNGWTVEVIAHLIKSALKD